MRNKRTDESFSLRLDIDHHISTDKSALELIGYKMVFRFAYEGMHMCDLGVGKYMPKCFVANRARDIINVPLLCLQYAEYAGRQPSNFARSPRTLAEVANFKATECKKCILYTGPVILRKHLSSEAYDHFLRFSLGYRIISSDLFRDSLDVAEQLFKDFVEHFMEFIPYWGFGYNVHGLLHIVDDCRVYGTVNSFSAYRFEFFFK